MYEKHFHLKTSPFSLGPDPDGVYITETITEALAMLAYGVNRQTGFILLTGDVGTGKTTILNIFMRFLQGQGAATAFIFNPHLKPDDFLDIVLTDFGLARGEQSMSQRMTQFNQWLLERYHEHSRVVLLVDEAQQLSEDVLEELRLLTNLETPMHKLLQIVLCGQPELNDLLARPSLRQLRQRIGLRCRTAPFTAEQTAEYISKRLCSAGARDSSLFDPEAVRLIHQYAGGIPRVINALCDQLLVEAFCDGRPSVGIDMVRKIAIERELGPGKSWPEKNELECAPAHDAV